ncbi:type VI secretion system-associated protein TagF [Roseomonas alkaliterrae]|uniref:type VI secretion system-associated protein TagF n=1 Tax=Neoroseomonas alkaliterrae TaxID=1452450 RepID=UPI001BA63BA9|nr:type VI secretion system-associated protein TagF [Neoroseomonas alkaliterrae]MBR0677726.1 type VI secretion system-associated protein TagF [Neoroseomonas alkaliterrae]
MPDPRPLTGLYGKVPAHGDFVRRGLPTSFVGPWDEWLQHGMAAARERLGPRWAEAWDGAPAWRFALPAGACGPDAVAGVMLASQDMVGRRFPITLAALLPPGAPTPEEAWFAAVEAAAIAGRRGRADADALLAAIPRPGDPLVAAPPLDDGAEGSAETAVPDPAAWAAAWETVAAARSADDLGATPQAEPGDVLALLGGGPRALGDAAHPAPLPGGSEASVSAPGGEDSADVLALIGVGPRAAGDAVHQSALPGGSEASVPAPAGKDSADVLALLGAASPAAGDAGQPAGLPGGSGSSVPAPDGEDSADVLALLGGGPQGKDDANHSTGRPGGSEASVPSPDGEDSADVLALLGAADPLAGDVANPAGLPGGSAAAVPVPGGHDSADVLALFAGGGDRAGPERGNADRSETTGNAEGRASGGAPDPWAPAALPGAMAGDQPVPGDADGGSADVLALLTRDAGSRLAPGGDPPPNTPGGVLALSGDGADSSASVAAMQDPLSAAGGTLPFLAGEGSAAASGPAPAPSAPLMPRGDPAPSAPPGGGWWTRGAARVPACVRAIPRLPPASDFVSLLEADA